MEMWISQELAWSWATKVRRLNVFVSSLVCQEDYGLRHGNIFCCCTKLTSSSLHFSFYRASLKFFRTSWALVNTTKTRTMFRRRVWLDKMPWWYFVTRTIGWLRGLVPTQIYSLRGHIFHCRCNTQWRMSAVAPQLKCFENSRDSHCTEKNVSGSIFVKQVRFWRDQMTKSCFLVNEGPRNEGESV